MARKGRNKALDKLIRGNIIKVDDEQKTDLGEDLHKITGQLTADENVFKFGRSSKTKMGYDSILGALGDKPYYKPDIRPRYEFIRHFRYHYAVNSSAVKSAQADRFKDLAGSLVSFKGALAYREAGVPAGFGDEERKHSFLDKIRKS